MTDTITVQEAILKKGCTPGQLALSKAGHDRGRIYLIIRVEQDFAYCAEGNLRPIDKPKLKRITHLKLLGTTAAGDFEQLIAQTDPGQQNARIRQLIQRHPSWTVTANP